MQRAFSLVELSIVLVILGLLTGGILAGQSLIKAAQLRGVSNEYTRYVTAMNSFKDKYFMLPGDLNTATSFWGTDAGGCPGTSATTTTPGVLTCNGDGDGNINESATTSNEIYRAWQHLANAALIEGSYTGVTNHAAVPSALSVSITTPNIPTSRLPNGYWQPMFRSTHDVSSISHFEGSLGTTLIYGTGSSGRTAFLNPEDSWNIDTKLDDGKPGTGRVVSGKTAAQANATTGCSNIAYSTAVSISAASEYLLSNPAPACVLYFKTGF